MKLLNNYSHPLFFLLCLLGINLQGQNTLVRVYDLPVNIQNAALEMPWTGGLLNPQFYNLDFDFDGDDDLICFDHQGNFLLVFENTSLSGQAHEYSFRPWLKSLFPSLSNWIQIRDFNCDGIKDIISYNPANGNVLQHTGAQGSNGLITFNLHDNFIYTLRDQNTQPLPFGQFDRPAFEDIDGDGDLDLLIFNFSDQVDYHANRSMEWYGHCDSLDFEFVTDCWGGFDEEQDSFDFALDIVCDSIEFSAADSRHVGSSRILPIDYGADGVWDIIAGYGHTEKLGFLVNGGSTSDAYMDSVDNLFPANDEEIRLPVAPAAYLLDIDGDEIKELIVTSSFDGKAENNVWLYQNAGTTAFPIWEKEKDGFLQEKMLDVGGNAKPTFVDYNLDGLLDMVVSNRGIAAGSNANDYTSYLSLFENTGTSSDPVFELIEKDWMSLSLLALTDVKATFGDLDGDGDSDLIIGDFFGKLLFIENIAAAGMEINLDMNNAVDLGFDIGNLATPHLTDVDEDGLLDLLVGEIQGRVFYYHNEGTAEEYSFVLSNNIYGGVDVRPAGSSIGNSSPFLFRPAAGEDRILLVGNSVGEVFAYSGVDDQQDLFKAAIPETAIIKTGTDAVPAILYSDDLDQHYLMTGTGRGGIQLYQFKDGISALEEAPNIKSTITNNIRVFPNPAEGKEVTLEFPAVAKNQSGVLRGFNSLGTMAFEFPLDLNTNSTKYTVDFSEWWEESGLVFLEWVGKERSNNLVGKVVFLK